jgi:succinate dehydrogenase/fumarate reductase flavoprotein subunit
VVLVGRATEGTLASTTTENPGLLALGAVDGGTVVGGSALGAAAVEDAALSGETTSWTVFANLVMKEGRDVAILIMIVLL